MIVVYSCFINYLLDFRGFAVAKKQQFIKISPHYQRYFSCLLSFGVRLSVNGWTFMICWFLSNLQSNFYSKVCVDFK